MKFNHFCLIVGIILIVLSLSVFANACCGVPVTWNGCSVPNNSCLDSCDRCGSSCSPDTLSCGDTVNSCINGTFFEVDDSDTSYNWGCKKGDDYTCCSLNKPENGVCGVEIDSCISGEFIDVSDSTTQFKWNCNGLYGGVDASCVVNNPCGLDMAPYILNIPSQSLPYTQILKIDLWNYVKDYDDFPGELELFLEVVDGESIECEIESNRFFECSVIDVGETVFGLTAIDSCGKDAYKEFSINVTNSSPIVNVPDKLVGCSEDLTKFIDLRNHSFDEEKNELVFEIIDQSNPNLVDCVIEDDFYLSCVINFCSNESSQITLGVDDVFGEYYESTFSLKVRDASPVWKEIPSTCINESASDLIDLRDYAVDKEDGSDLTFSLSNSLSSGLICNITSDYLIDCELSSNKNLINKIDVNAEDSFGNISKTVFYVSGNCSDSNQGSISLTSEVYGVCLEKCSTYSFPLLIKNNSNERKCFDLESKSTPYNYLETSISNNSFCLNKGEEREVTLNVDSCTAEERKYTVMVFDRELDLEMNFEFEVGSCSNFDGFLIEEYNGKICKGERKDFTVLVKNNSSLEKKIYLSAENSMILPHFDKDYIVLDGGESSYVSLRINALSLLVGAKEVVSILGEGEEYYIKKLLNFEVVDCSDTIKRTLELSLPNICFDVRRGQVFNSQFTIRRNPDGDDCLTSEKEFFLSIFGTKNELSYNTVSLKKGDSRTIYYSLFVPDNLSAGKNYVTVNASDGFEWNSFSESKEICLNVLPESSSSFFVRTQLKDVIWCGSSIFEVEVINNGDLDENYSVSVMDYPTGVTVSFSSTNFTVKKGEKKTIFVSVVSNPNSRVADEQKIQLKLTNQNQLTSSAPLQLTSTIFFNIKEKTAFDNLQILSATSRIDSMNGFSAPFNLKIRNNSGSDVRDTMVLIEALPNGVNYENIVIPLIKSGEVIDVEGILHIGDDINGEFTSVFVIQNGELVNKKEFLLVIEQNKGFFAGLFTGLFSMGVNPNSGSNTNGGGEGIALSTISALTLLNLGVWDVIGLIFSVIILIVLVWLITLGVLTFSKTKTKKEVWMED